MTSRATRHIVVSLLLGITFLAPASRAAGDQSEPGAFLVYPFVVVESPPGSGPDVETFVTVTNMDDVNSYVAHLVFFNGDSASPSYCSSCDFDFVLGPRESDTLVFKPEAKGGTRIMEPDGPVEFVCPHEYGFVTISLENGSGVTQTDNVLRGNAVVFDYTNGRSQSIPATVFQGGTGNGDRIYQFNDVEYGRIPRYVAVEFMAPDLPGGGLDAYLSLFTLGFTDENPPLVDCSVYGYDALGISFSSSFQFGCWTHVLLHDIHSEFAYPFLGIFAGFDETGWLLLNCRVDVNPGDADGWEADGGVHGAFSMVVDPDTPLLRNDAGPHVQAGAWWGRPLGQSVVTGDPLTLDLEPGR